MIRIAASLFLSALIFSPLAFGASEAWSQGIMELLCIGAFLFLLLGQRLKKQPFYEPPGALPLLLFLLFIALQIIPLPAALVKFISPGSYAIRQTASGIIESPAWLTLSINPQATLAELLRYAAYASFYILTVQLLSRKEMLQKTVTVVVVMACLIGIEAILQYFSYALAPGNIPWDRHKIFWFREVPLYAMPVGPYVYHNHYAGLMEMLLPLMFVLFLIYRPSVSYGGLRRRLSTLLGEPRSNLHLLLGFAGIVTAASFFMSMSRGGIISLCLAMVILVGMIVKKKARREHGLLLVAVLLLVVLGVGWLGWGPILDRFAKLERHVTLDAERLVYWKDSLGIMKEFPVAGSGLGTFAEIYPLHKSTEGTMLVNHAHNDYLELLTNGGLIAFGLVAWFVFVLVNRSFQVYRKRHDLYSVYLYLGSLTGIIALLIHSAVDFNFQNGANGLYFFLMAGLLVSAANTRLHNPGVTHLRPLTSGFQKAVMPCAIVMAGCLLVANVSRSRGSFYQARIKSNDNQYLARAELFELRDLAQKAVAADPLAAEHHYVLAGLENRLSANSLAALEHYVRAVQLNPTNSQYLQQLGQFLGGLGKEAEADAVLKAGIRLDRTNPHRYKPYVAWLLTAGKKEEAIAAIKEVISLFPHEGIIREYLKLMVLEQWPPQEIRQALPAMAKPHLYFAEYLEKLGNKNMAAQVYDAAMPYLESNEKMGRGDFYQLSDHYRKNGRFEETLQVMLKALEFFPNDVRLRLDTAQLYEQMGIDYRAIEEYRQALVMQPGELTAAAGLRKLTKGLP